MRKREAEELLEAARQCSANHADAQRRKGLTRVSVWVPEEDTERLKDVAARMRKDAGKPLPGDNYERPKAVEVPVVDARYPTPARAWLEVGPDELGLRRSGWHGGPATKYSSPPSVQAGSRMWFRCA